MDQPIESYGCTKCQVRHYKGDKLYPFHIDYQSKDGIEMRTKPKPTKQSILGEN